MFSHPFSLREFKRDFILGLPYRIAKSTITLSLPILLFNFVAWFLVKYKSGDSLVFSIQIFCKHAQF